MVPWILVNYSENVKKVLFGSSDFLQFLKNTPLYIDPPGLYKKKSKLKLKGFKSKISPPFINKHTFSVNLPLLFIYKFCSKEIKLQPSGEPRE